MNNSIGENIKNYRKFSNISRKELAEKIGMSASGLANCENGNRLPSLDMLKKISKALNITVDDLINEEIEANERYWEAIKDFGLNDIKQLIDDLKNITLTKTDKKILDNQEKILFRITYQYEHLLQPLAKELLTGDIDIIYGDKLKAATNMTVESLNDIESTLKIIKDKYI